mmetsp:Transcript_24419/g.68630  ORF Transcript_24419/g.68630 Transcript_24419/m.68630 type:complete len:93 (-) Transcript_24419:63-341(-)
MPNACFIGLATVANTPSIVFDTSRSMEAIVCIIATCFHFVFTRQAHVALGAHTMLEKRFIVGLVQVTNLADSIFVGTKIFDAFSTCSSIETS